MIWLLVIVTYMGGNAPGPVVHTHEFKNIRQCEAAALAVVSQVDAASSSNATAPGQTEGGITRMGRQVVSAKCHPLSPQK